MKGKAIKTRIEDKAIMTITHSVGLMSYNILYDKFGFGEKQIRKYYSAMIALKEGWSNDQVPTKEMLVYCEKKKVDVYGFMKKIPQSKKIALIGKNVTTGVIKFIEAGFMINILMSVIILKEEFKFTNPMIKRYLDYIEYFTDSYTRKMPRSNECYLNDNMILAIFREEMHLDLETGLKV